MFTTNFLVSSSGEATRIFQIIRTAELDDYRGFDKPIRPTLVPTPRAPKLGVQ